MQENLLTIIFLKSSIVIISIVEVTNAYLSLG